MYALATNGTLLASFNLNKTVDDVEDIAVGRGPVPGRSYLYVGDIGGNVGGATVRSQVQILRIPEPPVDLAWAGNARSEDFADVETFTLDYLQKTLRVKKRDGRTWNFTTRAANADPLLVFQRDVDRARARLAH